VNLHQFWFRFRNVPEYSPLVLGCGVTAFSHDDALALLAATIFADGHALPIDRVIEDAHIEDLETGPLLPDADVVQQRGVWFPKGYQAV